MKVADSISTVTSPVNVGAVPASRPPTCPDRQPVPYARLHGCSVNRFLPSRSREPSGLYIRKLGLTRNRGLPVKRLHKLYTRNYPRLDRNVTTPTAPGWCLLTAPALHAPSPSLVSRTRSGVTDTLWCRGHALEGPRKPACRPWTGASRGFLLYDFAVGRSARPTRCWGFPAGCGPFFPHRVSTALPNPHPCDTHWAGARSTQPTHVPLESGGKERSRQRERGSHVCLSSTLMSFGFPFPHKRPGSSVS